ncbi:MAG TPA: hypothetical protein VF665_01080 [Longimicrobium sp.]|jgi:hypothetical protein|uniref:hypothetical protein n=1 Tax=Longimicrobium sp. TaxID=2029185 RepID=UPI002ED790BD
MINRTARLAALVLIPLLSATAARAQEALPRVLPWGITGAEASTQLTAGDDLRIVTTRAGREIYAVSSKTPMQAVAILSRDMLVGLLYFHAENAVVSARDLFAQALATAERIHGPPYCRRPDHAVWALDGTVLEVRLRRPRGDGARGAEIRYTGPGYEAEMARRAAVTAAAPRPRPRPAAGGRRLLGVSADSVAPEPATAAPDSATAPPPAAAPVPVDPQAAVRALCG